MTDLTRVGISLSADFLAQFDRLIAQQGYETRSEAVRDLIRDRLIAVTAERASCEMVGTVTMVYDHHTRQLLTRLIALQHQQDGAVLATMHVHLDAAHCLAVLVLRGMSEQLRRMADRLIGLKGVMHGTLVLTTARPELP